MYHMIWFISKFRWRSVVDHYAFSRASWVLFEVDKIHQRCPVSPMVNHHWWCSFTCYFPFENFEMSIFLFFLLQNLILIMSWIIWSDVIGNFRKFSLKFFLVIGFEMERKIFLCRYYVYYIISSRHYWDATLLEPSPITKRSLAELE